ncbi:MAG: hypothetical protein Q4C42_05565 [Clostridia bacterium]|nr:hypothetical protein [Clostridia bacterium]
MKKSGTKSTIIGAVLAILVLFLSWFVGLTPINIHDEGFWVTIIMALFAFIIPKGIAKSMHGENAVHIIQNGNKVEITGRPKADKALLIPVALILVMIIAAGAGSTVLNAGKYSSILEIQQVEFTDDMDESVGTSSIALMDTASAKMLGDREIGSLANVVSQFNVSPDYTQIDFGGVPKKVAALEYAGFFKWFNNRNEGVPGYVTVDPVSMSASYKESSGMKYVPSAYLFEDAARHIRLAYPTEMFGNLHFEIDEDGNPFYVVSVYKRSIGLFGGQTVSGCIVLDPVSGEMQKYDTGDVPHWVDVVFDGNLICEQYNWHGELQNGFWNSVISKKGCKQVTTYIPSDAEDDPPTSDYGYVAKDGDIWIYTGVTSVNGDSSNIGFLLANERTGEAHYYAIAGADEKSAMAAAEGEVQEKGYQASFPSLINVDGRPTYIMVLKDASGLVKLYAAVNVEQYNLVTTASSQAECMVKYRNLLGINSDNASVEADGEYTIIVKAIRYIDIEGNTYIYLVDENDSIYRAKAADHEELIPITEGEIITIICSGKEILSLSEAKG